MANVPTLVAARFTPTVAAASSWSQVAIIARPVRLFMRLRGRQEQHDHARQAEEVDPLVVVEKVGSDENSLRLGCTSGVLPMPSTYLLSTCGSRIEAERDGAR